MEPDYQLAAFIVVNPPIAMNRFHQDKSTETSEQSSQSPPLREFNYGAHKKGSARHNQRFVFMFYWLLPLLVLLLIVAAGTYALIQFYGQDEVEASRAASGTFDDFSTSMKADQLLNAYLNALGGRQALQNIRSVRYEGKVSFSDGESSFQILLLQPDKGMLVTDPGGFGRQRFFLNGDLAWRIVEQRDGGRTVVPLDAKSTGSLKWSLRVHNTFRRLALEGQHRGLTVKEMEYLDKPCYELTKEMPDGSVFLVILDQETLYPLKMEEILRVGEEDVQFTVKFDDYRMVAGVAEPYRTVLYRNGVMDNEVEMGSIQINSGVISSLFEIPEELMK